MSEREIHLSVRIRPLSRDRTDAAVDVDSNTGAVVLSSGESFNYPSSVVKGSNQNVAFGALAFKLIERARKGYNCTIMAYGQTGSGKTHTMFGPPGCLTETAAQQASSVQQVPEAWGLFPRTVLTMMQDPESTTVYASAVEVYQENIFDLLDDRAQLQISASKPIGLKVGGDADRLPSLHGVHPACCTCFKCFQGQEAAKKARENAKARGIPATALGQGLGQAGRSNRSDRDKEPVFATVGEQLTRLRCAQDVARFARTVEGSRTARGHVLNDRSSRSHCLVKVHVTRSDATSTRTSRVTLLFVDLAGSERLHRTQAEGNAKAEAQSINASLSALGRVIKALGSRAGGQGAGGAPHVPYRDSPLTMLLRDSLGGKSCTSVVINVAAEAEHCDESRCSLKFGERMGLVRNAPCAVVDASEDDVGVGREMLARLLGEARQELAKMAAEGLGGGFVDGAPVTEVESLRDNMRKLAEAQGQVQQILVQIAETKSSQGGSPGPADRLLSCLKQKLRKSSEQADVFRGLVERQQTIKTLWSLPTPAFRRKAAEVRELEGRVTLLSEDATNQLP